MHCFLCLEAVSVLQQEALCGWWVFLPASNIIACCGWFAITPHKRGTETLWKTHVMYYLSGETWMAAMHCQLIRNIDAFVLELLIQCRLLHSRQEARVICSARAAVQLRWFERSYRSRKCCLSSSCGIMSTWVWLVLSAPGVLPWLDPARANVLHCAFVVWVICLVEYQGLKLRWAWCDREKSYFGSVCICNCCSETVTSSWNTESLSLLSGGLCSNSFGLRKPTLLLALTELIKLVDLNAF